MEYLPQFLMEETQISTPLVWKEVDAERILIGKVLSSKTYTRAAMESILQKAWNLQAGFDVIEITRNAFMFKFLKEDEYSRILRGRPWSINGCLLNLQERSKYKSCEELDFNRCPVWIQLHNVPMEAMCLENVIMIGGYVGEVVLAEDPHYNGRYLRSFLRAKVVLDLRKPLPYGFWMPKPDGKKTWISIRYEKLQNFCFNCGKIGHDNCSCRSERLMSVLNLNEPRYGAWLTTNVCRSWDEIMVVVHNDWEEAEYVRRKKEEAMMRNKGESRKITEMDPNLVEEDLFVIRINKSELDGKRVGEKKEGEVKAFTVRVGADGVNGWTVTSSNEHNDNKAGLGKLGNRGEKSGSSGAKKAKGENEVVGSDASVYQQWGIASIKMILHLVD